MINSRTDTVTIGDRYSAIKVVWMFLWCTLTDLQLFNEVNKNNNFSSRDFILQALDALQVIITSTCQWWWDVTEGLIYRRNLLNVSGSFQEWRYRKKKLSLYTNGLWLLFSVSLWIVCRTLGRNHYCFAAGIVTVK